MSKLIAFIVAFIPLVAQVAVANPDAIKTVPTDQVCMVNDRFFGSPQIPVVVGNRTYYGCCSACKTTLTTDESSRLGTDPISKRQVDKAEAVIGSLPDGRVVYFENIDNLNRYRLTE